MFCASFQFYFLCIFLVRGDLVSKHEQLLILTGIGVSTLPNIDGPFVKIITASHQQLNNPNYCLPIPTIRGWLVQKY
jgi:hypothetical protein